MTATVLSTFLVVGAATAQTPAPAPPPAASTPTPAPVPFPTDARIGFVNMMAVLENAQTGKTVLEKLDALRTQKTTELAAKEKELQTLQLEIQNGQNVLAAAVLAQKQAELDRRQRELQFTREQAQVDFDNLRSELFEDFGQKVLPIVEQIRTERNLWVVYSAGDGSGIAAVHPGLDVSAEVVRRLDAAK